MERVTVCLTHLNICIHNFQRKKILVLAIYTFYSSLLARGTPSIKLFKIQRDCEYCPDPCAPAVHDQERQ